MSSKPALFGNLTNYLTGRVLVIVVGLASFPLMTRMLSVSEYGVVSLTLRLVLLLSVLSKCGLQYSAARFYEHSGNSDDPGARRRFYSTLVLGPLLVAVCLVALYLPALFALRSRLADPILFRCLLLAAALIVFRSLQSILLSLLRNEGRSALHSSLEVLVRVLTLASFVVLAWSGLRSAIYILAGLVFAEGLVILLQLALLARDKLILPRLVDWSLLRTSLMFGAPLIAYELSSIVLDSGDRILVRHFLGDTQLGLYSAAYNLSSYLQDTVMTPINLAIIPVYMRMWKHDGLLATARFLSNSLTWFIVLACCLTGLAFLCARDFVVLLASARFAEASHLLPVLVPGLMLYATHIFLNVGLVLQKRTGLLAALVLISAVANLTLNWALLPRLGLLGGAWATLLSYLLLIGLLAYFNQKILPVTPDIMLCLRAVIAAFVAYFGASLVHSGHTSIALLVRIPLDLTLFVAAFILPSASLRVLALTNATNLRKCLTRTTLSTAELEASHS